MKIAAILVVSYVIAGFIYVWRDLNEHPIRVKLYILRYRRTGEWQVLLFPWLGWIIGVIANTQMMGRISGNEALPIAVFIGVATILWFLLI